MFLINIVSSYFLNEVCIKNFLHDSLLKIQTMKKKMFWFPKDKKMLSNAL